MTSICFKKVPPFVNKYDIDDFIDELWMYNCPDSYSTSDINRQTTEAARVHNENEAKRDEKMRT